MASYEAVLKTERCVSIKRYAGGFKMEHTILRNSFKFFLGLLTVICLFPFCKASATISDEQIAIGGITYMCHISYVLDKFGPPHRIESGGYYWGGNSLFVNTWSSAKGQTDYVTEMKTSANNGIETPAGVIVGMKDTVLNQVYGQADMVVDSDRNGCTVYIYNSPKSGSLAFRVKNGVIKSIEMAGFFS